jgi:putative tryptophan/tyrosine transport system substrate-binding protein
LAAKKVELLAQTFPGRTRLAILWDALVTDEFNAAEQAAEIMQLQVRAFKLEHPPYDFTGAFRNIAQSDSEMVLVLSSPLFAMYREQLAHLATQYRLPAMFIFKSYVRVGGLMSYGPQQEALYRQTAGYVAKILNGAKPADLPVEQPTKFELVINLKTARAIGVELSTATLLRADEVIE